MLDVLVLLEIFLYNCDHHVFLFWLIIDVVFQVLRALVLKILAWNICHIVVLKGERSR